MYKVLPFRRLMLHFLVIIPKDCPEARTHPFDLRILYIPIPYSVQRPKLKKLKNCKVLLDKRIQFPFKIMLFFVQCCSLHKEFLLIVIPQSSIQYNLDFGYPNSRQLRLSDNLDFGCPAPICCVPADGLPQYIVLTVEFPGLRDSLNSHSLFRPRSGNNTI